MRKIDSIKILGAALVVAVALAGFYLTPKSAMQTLKAVKTPEKASEVLNEVKGYQGWTKISDKNFVMDPATAAMCAAPSIDRPFKASEIAGSPHRDKYLNVYVNALGRDEMITKKNPQFPVGSVVVKEKLDAPESRKPELLTVMIKREKGFNPLVGDWEFAMLDGAAAKVIEQGKLESCAKCHRDYRENDFITRVYLTDAIKQQLK